MEANKDNKKVISFEKRIVFLCDCLDHPNIEDFIQDNSDLRDRKTVTNSNGPLTTHTFLSDNVRVAVEDKDTQFLFILKSANEMMYMSTLLANSQVENKLDDYPTVDPNEIGVYDVYDGNTVVPLVQDGYIRECGFDSAMRVLMNDYLHLQSLNKPDGPSVSLGDGESAEHTVEIGDEMPEDFVPDRVQKIGDAVEELESVQDVIQKRKAK